MIYHRWVEARVQSSVDLSIRFAFETISLFLAFMSCETPPGSRFLTMTSMRMLTTAKPTAPATRTLMRYMISKT